MNNFKKVKDAVDIVEVIQQAVDLKKVGTNYKGLCPFHNEKSPSFFVSQKKGIYKCFGCGETGDAISFVSKFNGLSPYEAMTALAQDNNVEIEEREEKDINVAYKENKTLMIAFQSSLLHNKAVKKYIYKRGVTSLDIIKTYHIGYSEERMLNGRLIFGITDEHGNIAGFSGRTLKKKSKEPKYINSKESDVFSKKELLYGLFQHKRHIKASNCCIITEGFFDLIALLAKEIRHTVATCGTALTKTHCLKLRKYCNNAILAFDNDKAGIEATKRAMENLWLSGFKDLEVAQFKAKDVDLAIRNGESLTSLKAIDWLMQNAELQDVLQYISNIKSPVQREQYLKKMEEHYNMPVEALREEMNQHISKAFYK